MKKQSMLFIPILIVFICILSKGSLVTQVCTSTIDSGMEQFTVEVSNNDKVNTIVITFEGNLEEPVNSDTLPAIQSTIQTIYTSIDGVGVTIDESELGDTYAKISLSIDATLYDFETDDLNRFYNLEMSEDTLSFTDLTAMFAQESYECNELD